MSDKTLIEELGNSYGHEIEPGQYDFSFHPLIGKVIAALSAKPERNIPLEPTRAMIEAGAQRLVRCGEGENKWPDDWAAVHVAAARSEAERVWRSMWLEAVEGKPEPTKAERLAALIAERDALLAEDDKPEAAKPAAERVEAFLASEVVNNIPEGLNLMGRVISESAVRNFLTTLTAEHEAQLAAKEAEIARREAERNEVGELVDRLYTLLAYRESARAAQEVGGGGG